MVMKSNTPATSTTSKTFSLKTSSYSSKLNHTCKMPRRPCAVSSGARMPTDKCLKYGHFVSNCGETAQSEDISFPSLFNRDGFEYIRTPVFGVSGFLRDLSILEDRRRSPAEDAENALGRAGWEDAPNPIKDGRRVDGNGGTETPNNTRRELRGTV